MMGAKFKGRRISSVVVLISKQLSDSLPKGWCGSVSASGWMTHDTFLEYLKNHLYPLLSEKGTKFPVVLIVDNASSHISIEASGI